MFALMPADLHDPATLPLGLPPRTVFVTGKGGVGKSTVAAALALAYRDAGVRTLLVQIAGQEPASRLLAPRTTVGYDAVTLAPRLSALTIDAEGALREYARLRLKVRAVADRLVGNPIFHQFADAAPGFRELLIMGKLWSLSNEEGSRRRRKYETIVVDAPATGHGTALLGMAGTVARMFPVGPIANEARQVDEFVRDPERVGVVLVSLPEELPVTEAIELHGRLAEHGVSVSATVLNGLVPQRFDAGEIAHLSGLIEPDALEPPVRACLQVAAREHARALQQTEERERLEQVTGPVYTLPLMYRAQLTRADVQQLAALLHPVEQRDLRESLA